MDKEQNLTEIIEGIKPLDARAMELSQKKWNSIAKPLHSLGKLENYVMQIAGITGNPEVSLEKKALIIMCADNGVVEEGVTQTGQEVTAIVAENFLDGNTSAAIMCKKSGVDLFPIDIGMAVDTRVPRHKQAYGTENIAKGPAMTRQQAVAAILTGIDTVKEKKEAGYQILATGEMGIGNTTTSSAVSAVLLDLPVELMTGRGAGLTSEGLNRKVQAIQKAIEINQPDKTDAIDVLAKVGGYDLAGLAGVFLGGAYYHIPVVIDGFISAVAALAAARICETSKSYMLVSHVSKEPGMHRILEALGMTPALTCDMCLGEGTGAVAFLPVLEMAVEVYQKMSTFSDIQIEDYEELGDK
jgi:nicotinate-nucleotide--dimethylbenzimidazole phosphoribosyltransferase